MAFLDTLRRRMRTTPGYAGGSLEEQIARDSGQDQMLTQRNQEAVTRPRTVNPQLPTEMTAPPTTRERTVTYNQQTGRPNEDFYRDRGDTEGLYNALQEWEPRGGKRGFKNSLKSGLMYAAQAIQQNPDDPITAGIAGFGVGAGGATASPNFTNRLRRQWKLQQTGGELKNKLALDKEQAQIAGIGSQADAREAAIRQGDERLRQGETRLGHQSAQMLARILNAREEFDPDDPENQELVNALRAAKVPVVPKKRGQQLKWVQNAATGQWEIMAGDKSTGLSTSSTVTTPSGTPLVTTSESELNRRTRRVEGEKNRQAAETRARIRREGTGAKPDRVSQRRAAKLVSDIEYNRKAMAAADANLAADPNSAKFKEQRATAQADGERAATELNALNAGYEAGKGEKGYPYYKQRGEAQSQQGGQYAGKRISKSKVPEFARRHGMSIEEAQQYLIDQKAIVY